MNKHSIMNLNKNRTQVRVKVAERSNADNMCKTVLNSTYNQRHNGIVDT